MIAAPGVPPKRFIAYVDEAGDEGFGKLSEENTGQSSWFSIGGCVVAEEDERALPSWRDEIMGAFKNRNSRDLHFRDLKHEQKVHACATIATKPIGACVVSSNKHTLPSHPKAEVFKTKQHLYNYLTRYFLERITSACKKKARIEHGAPASLRVVFSQRKGSDYEVMRDYLKFLRDGKEKIQPVRTIDWSVLDPDDIAVENHKVRAGLQIADLFTSAVWKAFEPNGYGHCEPRYAQEIAPRLMRSNKSRLNCGLTIIPPYSKCPLGTAQKEFLDWIIEQDKR